MAEEATPAPEPTEEAPAAPMDTDTNTRGTPSWLPLESNPDVLNPFCKRLGLPDGFGFADVFGLDEELLCMIPQPCFALCLLYPSGNISRSRRTELRTKRAEGEAPAVPGSLFYVQQHDDIGNACGTIATIHALANGALAGGFDLEDDSPLKNFMLKTADMDCGERGWTLAGEKALQELSDATAASGETQGAGTDDAQNQHFIAFVLREGRLFELDGRTFDENGVAFPVDHGEADPDTFVSKAAAVIRTEFMARDPENMNFNVTALCRLE